MRFGDLLAENCTFFLPALIRRPPLRMFPSDFGGEMHHEETRVMFLSSSEDRMIVAWVILTQYQRASDSRTKGQRDLRSDGILVMP